MPTDADLEREFADLAEAVRRERMDIDPFFARELDAKAAAGFPRQPRWRRLLAVSPMLVPGVAASMLLALVVSAALLSGSPGDDEAGSGAGSTAATEASPAAGRAAPAAADESALQFEQDSAAAPPTSGGGSPRSDARQGRKEETSAALVLAAKPEAVQRVADEIVSVTDRHRGFVMSSSVELAAGRGGATFELRVPSARLKAALADLSRIGQVRERREATQDITREFVSARSRLADARAERRGLLRQLARADTEAERESVKLRLREVGARIRAARTDLARVNNRASYSNISVSVVGDPAAGGAGDDGGSWSPGDAARDALRVLEVAVGVLLIGLAVALPLVLLGALALLLARIARRRRTERLLDAV